MAEAIDVHVARPLHATAVAVWAVLSDLSRLADWLEFAAALEDASGPEVVEGATYTVKPRGRMEPKTRWRVTAVEPYRRQVHESEMPMFAGVRSTIELAEASDGVAQVSVRWRGEPKNLAGRIMRPVFTKQITGNWARSLEALEALAAREPGP